MLSIIILGCGQRAEAYARFFKQMKQELPCRIAVVAIAEPHAARREAFAHRYNVSHHFCYSSHVELSASLPGLQADAALICTQDNLHIDCIAALLQAQPDIHILCEKPLAGTLQACHSINHLLEAAWKIAGQRIFAIGHVLRYNAHNRQLKAIVDSGVLGDLIHIQHTEPVGHAHFAHSYVRGHWRRQADAQSILLAKCCHDLDLIGWLVTRSGTKRRLVKVASLGSLSHFKRERKPHAAGDATRCLSCPLVETCVFSAKKIYLDAFRRHGELRGFQKAILEGDVEDVPNIMKALEETRYGQCVYECDNDVCDVQSVLLTYEPEAGYKTASVVQVSFSMVSTTEAQCVRKISMYGSHGELHANGNDTIDVVYFATGKTERHAIEVFDGTKESNAHGGGDYGLILAFLQAVSAVKSGEMIAANAQDHYLGCTLDEMIASHAVVFAAEAARISSSVVTI